MSEFCQDGTIEFEDCASEDITKTSDSMGPSESKVTNSYENENDPEVTKPNESEIAQALTIWL